MEWIWILVPLAGIAVGIVAILAEHQEKMAMIARGLLPQEKKPQGPPQPEDMLRQGFITASVGAGILLAQLLGHLSPWLLVPAMMLVCVGGALIAAVFVRKRV